MADRSSYAAKQAPAEKLSFNRDLLGDMFLAHEGTPHGVPAEYGWQRRPARTYGINIPQGWDAVVAWGQVYAEASQPNPDVDFPQARVHLKDLQLYIYSKDSAWILVQDYQDPIGAMYTEDLEDYSPERPYDKPAEIRKEAGGGISVTAGSGYQFHFFTPKKDTIDPDDIGGVFVVCKARLIGTENYGELPKYLVNIGGDWYRSEAAEHTTDLANNNDIALGRFKYVTPEWQYFIMHTFSRERVKEIFFPIE